MRKKIGKKVVAAILFIFAFFSSISGALLFEKKEAKAETSTILASEWIKTNGLTATYNRSGIEMNSALVNDTRKGILLTAEKLGVGAEGSGFSVEKTLNGVFEMDFRVYSEKADTTEDWWTGGAWQSKNNAIEIREVAITVTDKDTQESFTVYVAGGVDYGPFIPTARVGYGAVGENMGAGLMYKNYSDIDVMHEDVFIGNPYNTYLYGTSFSNRAKNDNGIIGAGYPTCIGFDPQTKDVYGYVYGTTLRSYCHKRVIMNLSDATHLSKAGDKKEALKDSTFENYSVKMTITDVADNKPANVLLYGINGQSFAGIEGEITQSSGLAVCATLPSDGLVNIPYKIPTPKAYDLVDGEVTFNGKVKVLDAGNNAVLAETDYTNGLTFTPTVAGKYKIVYDKGLDKNGKSRKEYSRYGYIGADNATVLNLTIVDEAPPLSIQLTEGKLQAIKGMVVDVGVKGVSTLDKLDGGSIAVLLSITKDGSAYGAYTNMPISKNAYVIFEQAGIYRLTYALTDYIGQTHQESLELTVKNFYATRRDENEAIVAYGEEYLVGKDTLVVYLNDGETQDYALAVEIKDGTGWRAIEANAQGAFSLKEVFLEKGVGRQDIRFAVTIGEQTIYVEYPILVKDATAPTLSIATMTGDAKEHTATSTALMKSYRIVKGGQIVVPSVTIPDDMDEGVAVEISWKTPSDAQITTTAGTSLTLNEVGVYYLVYRAEDGAGNIGHCTYKIEARNFWLDVMAEPKEMVLGAQYTPEKPIVKDFMTGEGISDFAYSTSITFRGKDLPNSNGMFTLDKAGVYTVQYVVAYEGQEERCETTVTVKDTTKPVIAINGNYKRKVDVNTTISLLTATAKDDGRDLDVEVLVLFNGSRLALENNAFQASTVGVYTIVYKAEDEAGNITEEKIEIQVVAKDNSSSCNSCISYATVGCFALLGIMLVCLLKRKERKD